MWGNKNRLPLCEQLAAPIILLLVAFAYWCGLFEPFERSLMDSRFHLVQREPSGGLVLVEIDPYSLHQLASWPWPRNYHAEVLDRLFDAGARTVAFDIDFSSHSSDAGDRALAAALKRSAGRTILPTFAQIVSHREAPMAPQQTFPNPQFDDAKVGAVNVYPAADSLIRQFPYGENFGNGIIASLPALLADESLVRGGQFYLDYGIRISGLPHLSFVDVLQGNFDPRFVAGKKILVGATAVELGDQFAAPVYRTLAGPLVQALAYESLVQGRALHRTGALPSLTIAGIVLILLTMISTGWSWRRYLVVLVTIWSGLYGLALIVAVEAPISVDLGPPAGAALAFCAFGMARGVERQARHLLRQRLADTRRRALMQCVLEDSFDGIMIVDEAGIVEIANSAAAKLLSRPEGEIVGNPIGDFFTGAATTPAHVARRWENEEDFSIAPGAPVEFEIIRPTGETLIVELAVSLSRLLLRPAKRTDQPVFFTYTFRDISERRRTEQALRTAMREALAANQAKSEFLANMSHELRTPLNAIIGFSEMIHGEVIGKHQNLRYRDYAGDILKSGRHLLEVINDILDMSKIEVGEFKLQEGEVDLADAIEQCLRMVRAEARVAVGLKFHADIPPHLPNLRADLRLIRQILLNVLSNATKFTPPGGTIIVSVVEADDALKVRIVDTGIGIPADEIPRVVLPFYQVDSKLSRGFEGTGLGLALVAAYMHLHQGGLSIDSQVGEGTAVTLSFPDERILPFDSIENDGVLDRAQGV